MRRPNKFGYPPILQDNLQTDIDIFQQKLQKFGPHRDPTNEPNTSRI